MSANKADAKVGGMAPKTKVRGVARRAAGKSSLPAAVAGEGKAVRGTRTREPRSPASTARAVHVLDVGSGRIVARTFNELYLADPMDRIAMIKRGIPATTVKSLAGDMNIASERLTAVLGFAPATVGRKARAGASLDADESTRLLGIARLVGQVEHMIAGSGDADGHDAFDAARWVARWIEQPVPALNNAKPADFLDTTVGQEMVCKLVAQMQSGAYA